MVYYKSVLWFLHTDDILDITLDNLLRFLQEKVGPKWYEFGEAIGIDDVVLDSIAKATSPENCIVEMLDYWLKYYDGKPTWKDVADVLYDIDLEGLAVDIEQVYKTSKNVSSFPYRLSSLFNIARENNGNPGDEAIPIIIIKL